MFSILTPTYNRAKELPRVYNSLKNQTYTDFEWIISDDGSADGTSNLVKEWQKKETDFKITYHVLAKNQGKSYAVNEGLELCERPYTLIADSDDTFVDTTLEDLKTLWEAVESTKQKDKIGAIWTLVKDEKGQLIGETFPKNLWQVSFKERVLDRKKPIAGEKWHCWRTQILKEYGMIVNPNAFIGEGATWNKINSNYDFLCVNVVHRIYWYSEDGLIHQKKSNLKMQKIAYYSTFYQLEKSPFLEIISTSHYRSIAFDHVKSSFFYSDLNFKLKGFQLVGTWLGFIWQLPQKAFLKVMGTK